MSTEPDESTLGVPEPGDDRTEAQKILGISLTTERIVRILIAVGLVVVSLFTVAIVPIGQLSESTTPLLDVVKIGAPNIPIDPPPPPEPIQQPEKKAEAPAKAGTNVVNLMDALRKSLADGKAATAKKAPAGKAKPDDLRRQPQFRFAIEGGKAGQRKEAKESKESKVAAAPPAARAKPKRKSA